MARRFHPDNNYGFDTTEMMAMINTATEGLQDQLGKHDAVKEEERDLAGEYVESIHLITILTQNQAVHRPNQRHHLLKNPDNKMQQQKQIPV